MFQENRLIHDISNPSSSPEDVSQIDAEVETPDDSTEAQARSSQAALAEGIDPVEYEPELTVYETHNTPTEAPESFHREFRDRVREHVIMPEYSEFDPENAQHLNQTRRNFVNTLLHTWAQNPQNWRMDIENISSNPREASDQQRRAYNDNLRRFHDTILQNGIDYYAQLFAQIIYTDTPEMNQHLRFNTASLGRLNANLAAAIPMLANNRVSLEGTPEAELFSLTQLITEATRDNRTLRNSTLERIVNYYEANSSQGDYEEYLNQARGFINSPNSTDLVGSTYLGFILKDFLTQKQTIQVAEYALAREAQRAQSNPEEPTPLEAQRFFIDFATQSQVGFTVDMLKNLMSENQDLSPEWIANMSEQLDANDANYNAVLELAAQAPQLSSAQHQNLLQDNNRLFSVGLMGFFGALSIVNLALSIASREDRLTSLSNALIFTTMGGLAADSAMGDIPGTSFARMIGFELVSEREIINGNILGIHETIKRTWLFNPTQTTLDTIQNPNFIHVLSQTFFSREEKGFSFNILRENIEAQADRLPPEEGAKLRSSIEALEAYFISKGIEDEEIKNQQLLILAYGFTEFQVRDAQSFNEVFQMPSYQYDNDPNTDPSNRPNRPRPQNTPVASPSPSNTPSNTPEQISNIRSLNPRNFNTLLANLDQSGRTQINPNLELSNFIVTRDITLPPGYTVYIRSGSVGQIEDRIPHVTSVLIQNPNPQDVSGNYLSTNDFTRSGSARRSRVTTQDIYIRSTSRNSWRLPEGLRINGYIDIVKN